MSLILSTSSPWRAEPWPMLRLRCDLPVIPTQDGCSRAGDVPWRRQLTQQLKDGCTGLVTEVWAFCCLLSPLQPSVSPWDSQPVSSGLRKGMTCLPVSSSIQGYKDILYRTTPFLWILGHIHSMVFHDGNTCLREVCILIKAWNEFCLLGPFLIEIFTFCGKRFGGFFASFHMTCVLCFEMVSHVVQTDLKWTM